MTIIIYFDENKKNYQKVRPKTDAKDPKDNFDGNIRKLVDHITKSDSMNGIRNYHSFDVIN